VLTHVSASMAGTDFTPPQRDSDLSAGPDTAVDFTGNVTPAADAHEPNGNATDATNNAVLFLPYINANEGDELSLSPGTDDIDLYKVAPGAGQGLRVRLTSPPDGTGSQLQLALYDGFMNSLSYTVATAADGCEARLAFPAPPTSIYVEVTGGATGRSIPYDLEIEGYSPLSLGFSATFDSAPLPGTRVLLRNAGGLSFGSFNVDDFGFTGTIQAKPGEEFMAECFRYGAEAHRHTRSVKMEATAQVVTFASAAERSLDKLEPNNSPFGLTARPLPFDTSASVDPDFDPEDNYALMLPGGTVVLDMSGSPDEGPYTIELYTSGLALVDSFTVQPGIAPAYAEIPAAADYLLRIYNPGHPARYALTVEPAARGTLTGNVQYLGGGTADAKVYCAELERSVFTDPATGTYSFGPVDDGTYTLSAYCAGYMPDQPSKAVTIAGADGGADFALALNAVDQDEPNDLVGTAKPATVGVDSSQRSIGVDGSDAQDWYSFPANAGDKVSVTIFWGELWHPWADLNTFAPGNFTMGSSQGPGAREQNVTFVAPATNTYIFQVTGGAVTYRYRVLIEP
jgi:hypothetical protein